jgi:PAS domain-containing protein
LLIDEIQEPKSILPYSLIRWEERRVGALPEQQPYLSYEVDPNFREQVRLPDSAVWIRMEGKNNSNLSKSWVLSIPQSDLNSVELYQYTKDGFNLLGRTGSQIPDILKVKASPYPEFYLEELPKSEFYYLLRIESPGGVLKGIFAVGKDLYLLQKQKEIIIQRIIFILFLILLFSFSLFALLRNDFSHFSLLIMIMYLFQFEFAQESSAFTSFDPSSFFSKYFISIVSGLHIILIYHFNLKYVTKNSFFHRIFNAFFVLNSISFIGGFFIKSFIMLIYIYSAGILFFSFLMILTAFQSKIPGIMLYAPLLLLLNYTMSLLSEMGFNPWVDVNFKSIELIELLLAIYIILEWVELWKWFQNREETYRTLQSEKSRISIQREKINHILKSNHSVICLIGTNGNLSYVNPSITSVLAFTNHELEEKSFFHLFYFAKFSRQSIVKQLIQLRMDQIASSKLPASFLVNWKHKYEDYPVPYQLYMESSPWGEIWMSATPGFASKSKLEFERIKEVYSIKNITDADTFAITIVQANEIPLDVNSKFILEHAIRELLFNSLEHGVLKIGSDQRAEWLKDNTWVSNVYTFLSNKSFPPIKVEALVEPKRLGLRISDSGPGFDWKSILPKKTGNIDRDSMSGLEIIVEVFDKIEFNERGNQVVVVKEFS